MILFSILSTFLFITYGSCQTTRNFQNCSVENLDYCASAIVMFGDPNFKLPQDSSSYDNVCIEQKSALACTQRWGRECLTTPLRKQMMQIAMTGPTKSIRENCTPEGSERYLKNLKCVNGSFAGGNKCVENLSSRVINIRRLKKKEKWIPAMCCLASRWKKCFDRAMQPHCDAEGQTFLKALVDSYLGDVTSLGCTANYNYNSQSCIKILRRVPKTDEISITSNRRAFITQVFKMFLEASEDGAVKLGIEP